MIGRMTFDRYLRLTLYPLLALLLTAALVWGGVNYFVIPKMVIPEIYRQIAASFNA